MVQVVRVRPEEEKEHQLKKPIVSLPRPFGGDPEISAGHTKEASTVSHGQGGEKGSKQEEAKQSCPSDPLPRCAMDQQRELPLGMPACWPRPSP